MALSRIWAAFILVSIVVAGVRYVFSPADKEIFGQMVTGKAGDTVRVATPVVAGRTDSVKGPGAVGSAAGPAGAAAVAPGYVVQKADGLIETCKNAVTLS